MAIGIKARTAMAGAGDALEDEDIVLCRRANEWATIVQHGAVSRRLDGFQRQTDIDESEMARLRDVTRGLVAGVYQEVYDTQSFRRRTIRRPRVFLL